MPVACVGVRIDAAQFEQGVNTDALIELALHSERKYGFDTRLSNLPTTSQKAEFIAQWTKETLNYRRGCIDHAKTRLADDRIEICVGFHDPKLAQNTLQACLTIAQTKAQTQLDQIDAWLTKLWLACEAQHPDFQASLLISAARSLGLPANRLIPGQKYWAYGQGTNAQVFFETMPASDSALASSIFRDKAIAKAAMASHGLPVLPTHLVSMGDDPANYADRISFPCVVKPNAAGMAKGVTVGVLDVDELTEAVAVAFEVPGTNAVMIEPQQTGTDYRIIAIRGKVVATIKRARTFVEGDGKRTLVALLDALNAKRRGNMVKARYLVPIEDDRNLATCLRRQNVRKDDILEIGQKVYVSLADSRSAGGTVETETRPVHPKTVAMIEGFSTAFGVDAVGFDFLSEDISGDPDGVSCAFIEANTTPGIVAAVSAGWDPDEIGRIVLGPDAKRVPTTVILSKSGSSQTYQAEDGEAVVSSSGIILNTINIRPVGHQGPWAAVRQAETHKGVERLTIFASFEEITTHGFPVDHVDHLRLQDVDLPKDWLDVATAISDCFDHKSSG